MRPVRAAVSATILAAIALAGTACATGAGATRAPAASVAESARSLGIAADLVFTTTVDGYDLAPQSVALNDAGGMSAAWFNATTHGMLTIRTTRGDLTQATCEAAPLDEAPGEPVTCTREGGVWHRSTTDVHEYMTARRDAVIRVSGRGAPPADLRAAIDAVHVPSAAEVAELFSDAPVQPTAPVERGDIPEHGDGAPVDPLGPGG